MFRIGRFPLFVAAFCAIALCACSGSTPLEQLEANRALYKAELNSFFVKEVPLVDESMPGEEVEGEEPAGDTGDAEEGDGEEMAGAEEGEMEAMAEPEVRLDVVLDVLVQHDTRQPLDGLTLDITMVDESQSELARWRRWVETTGLPKANKRPYSLTLEDVDYQEGYGFYVEVRTPVPAADRGEYREYAGL